jgi:carboxymethylenebutenolidase
MQPGFAAAVQPIAAATITTSAEGLIAGDTKIRASDFDIPAYRAMPEKGKSFPIVIVVQEIFGVHEHIKDVCRRLAHLGYVAVAPELYARQGNVSEMKDFQEIFAKVVSRVPDAQVMADLDAAVEWAARESHGDRARLGLTGFCWGGRIAWLYAAHSGELKAAAAWYGRVVGNPAPLQPKSPIDVVADLKAPVLGLYGGEDHAIPVDTLERMRAALDAAGKPSSIVIYPQAGHAFHADYRSSYHRASAEDGWRRMIEWFKKYGVA